MSQTVPTPPLPARRATGRRPGAAALAIVTGATSASASGTSSSRCGPGSP